jgi:hypothetical protein
MTPDPKRNNWPDGRILTHPEASVQTYVVNVARDDTLRLRSRPGTRFAAIAEIPADAADILAFAYQPATPLSSFWGQN